MEKRSAARELAFLALFQLPKRNPEKLSKMDLNAVILTALRTLSDHSKANLKKAEAYFIKTERSLMEYQVDHKDNEALDEGSRSVDLPQTGEFFDNLDNCYKSISLMREALQVPELYWHFHDQAIEDFTIELLFKVIQNRDEVNNLITEASKSWDISRLFKTDKTIIELAVAELITTDQSPAVVVSEAMKLANKYSSDEAGKFINGILADIIKTVSV